MVSATPTASAHPPKAPLYALTGLRFFPALHVVLYHLPHKQLEHAPIWLRNIIGSGFVGVSLFFVLSGFILSYSYLDSVTPTLDKRSFWMARIARIYPVYALGLFVALPFYLSYLLQQMSVLKALIKSVAGILFALSLLQSWLPQTAALLNHPSWSLSAEAFFYFVFPFLPRYLHGLSTPSLVGLMGLTWFLSLLAPLGYWHFFGPGTLETTTFWLGVVKFNPLLRLPEFLIGVYLGKLFLLKFREPRPLAALYSVIALLLVVLVLANSSHIPYVMLSNCVLVPVFAVLIFNLAFGRGLVSNVLSLRFIRTLGEASYALYIIHVPTYFILTAFCSRMNVGNLSGTFVLIYLSCVIITSLLILRFIENPAREALRGRLMRRSSPRNRLTT